MNSLLRRALIKRKAGACAPAFRLEGTARLEVQLAAELHFSSFVCAHRAAKGAVAETGIDGVEIGVVENVEGLSAHLQADAVAEAEVLHQAEVNLFEARAQDVSCMLRSEVALCGGEGGRVEPVQS